MVTWCNLSRQKFNTTKWVLFQISSCTSPPEYKGNQIKKQKKNRITIVIYKNVTTTFSGDTFPAENFPCDGYSKGKYCRRRKAFLSGGQDIFYVRRGQRTFLKRMMVGGNFSVRHQFRDFT